ncbi:MAG: OB-fold domain-containing protein [Pseudomonadota bacterium]
MMRLISENVVSVQDGMPVLFGGKSKGTGEIVFPYPEGAERERYEKVKLKSEGALWSYTIQRFPPKNPPYLGPNTPDTFEPFAVGYIELPKEVIVETRIVSEDFSKLKVGQAMRLTTVPFAEDEQGTPLHTYAFEPI